MTLPNEIEGLIAQIAEKLDISTKDIGLSLGTKGWLADVYLPRIKVESESKPTAFEAVSDLLSKV
jgi:hypothetical protein